jgi:mRNA-degrading endonuclease RelE of RelBE toxin-antitoxin system
MRADPLSGDVVPLKAGYRGAFRRRVGPWRIIFSVKIADKIVVVHDIRRRTSTTY